MIIHLLRVIVIIFKESRLLKKKIVEKGETLEEQFRRWEVIQSGLGYKSGWIYTQIVLTHKANWKRALKKFADYKKKPYSVVVAHAKNSSKVVSNFMGG